MKRTASASNAAKAYGTTRKKPKKMIEKIKALLQRFKSLPAGRQAHSKVFIVAVFSVFFLTLILTTLQYRAGQIQQNTSVQPTPTPRVLTPGKDYVEGQINVKFKDGLTDQEINQSLAKYSASIKSTIPGINVKVVEVPVGQENAIRKQLTDEGIVKYADLDFIGRTQFDPNDTDFPKQYGLFNTGQVVKGVTGTANADIRIKTAWDTTKGSGVKVAIIDTGIDVNHPEFASKIVAQKVLITSTIDDKFGHGTHVAGILSAVTNNTQGMSGVCPDCTLMIAKALDDTGNGPYSKIAEGIIWAADNGAKVINLSLGGYDADNTLKDSVGYAWGKGAVLVAAAGNDNRADKFYPGGFSPVVAVGATNNKDQRASFSNHGQWVMVAAPGKDIYSTFPTHSYALQNSKGTALNYDYISGTSMASPMVAGVVAMIWTTSYGTSNQAVVDRLYATADPIGGTGSAWQNGRVNAAAAVGATNTNPNLTPTLGPTITLVPPATGGPTEPVPTYVCGGSPNSICATPTLGGPGPTGGPNPTISQGPDITGFPGVTPPITQPPTDQCNNSGGGFIDSILQLIRDLLNKIFQLIGRGTPPAIPCDQGQNPVPNPPIISPDPNLPQPSVIIPTTPNAIPSSIQNPVVPTAPPVAPTTPLLDEDGDPIEP
ncbi:MAG TPA: S8 family serine peptidase [Xanthomonadales bacterium]|nr:S8 family serine peptidase [Xanthomonadales bacterium]